MRRRRQPSVHVDFESGLCVLQQLIWGLSRQLDGEGSGGDRLDVAGVCDGEGVEDSGGGFWLGVRERGWIRMFVNGSVLDLDGNGDAGEPRSDGHDVREDLETQAERDERLSLITD